MIKTKMSKFFYLIVIFQGGSMLDAGQTSRELKSCQHTIGKELIKTRHEYPDLQSRMYTLLDQVSKMYKLAMRAVSKKRRAKLLARQEQDAVVALRKENKSLSRELNQLKMRYTQSELQLSEQSKKIMQLTQQQEDIANKVAHLEILKKNKKDQIKPMSSTLARDESFPSEACSEQLVSS